MIDPDEDLNEEMHCIPRNDMREHIASRDCWCDPVEDDEDPDVWIHNSADGREDFETGARAPS